MRRDAELDDFAALSHSVARTGVGSDRLENRPNRRRRYASRLSEYALVHRNAFIIIRIAVRSFSVRTRAKARKSRHMIKTLVLLVVATTAIGASRAGHNKKTQVAFVMPPPPRDAVAFVMPPPPRDAVAFVMPPPPRDAVAFVMPPPPRDAVAFVMPPPPRALVS
jgi:hypothetical protein